MGISNIVDRVKMELSNRSYEVAFLAIIGGIGIGAYIAQGTEDYKRRREIAIEERKALEECREGLHPERILERGYYCVGPQGE